MDIQTIVDLHEKEIRIGFDDPDLEKEVLPRLVRLIRAEPGMGFIRHSRLDRSNADAEIQAQMAFFADKNLPFEWDLYDYDRPADLEQRLVSLGFVPDLEPDDPGAMLVLDIQEAPAYLLKAVTTDIRRITDHRQLDDVVQILEQVWGGNFGWLRTRLAGHMDIPGYLSIYTAYHQGNPTCCAWTYYYPDSHFAILRGGSTVPAYRQKGLYTAILAVRVQEALQRGHRFLIVDASPMSRPILEKHGFQVMAFARSYKWYPNKG